MVIRDEGDRRAWKTRGRTSICISCRRAIGGESGCSWSNDFIPVAGSEYELVPYEYVGEGKKKADGRGYCFITYWIKRCPLYEEDEKRVVKKK